MGVIKFLRDISGLFNWNTDDNPTSELTYMNAVKNWQETEKNLVDTILWQPTTAYSVGNMVKTPSLPSQYCLVCTTAGTSGANEPSYSGKTVGSSVSDGSVTWKVAVNFNNTVTYNATSVLDTTYIDSFGDTVGPYVKNIQGTLTIVGGHLHLLHFTCNPVYNSDDSSHISTIIRGGTTYYKCPGPILKDNYLPLNLPVNIAFRVSYDGLYDYDSFNFLYMGRVRETRTDQPHGRMYITTSDAFGTANGISSVFEITMMYWR